MGRISKGKRILASVTVISTLGIKEEKKTGDGDRGVQGTLEVGSMVDVVEIHYIHA